MKHDNFTYIAIPNSNEVITVNGDVLHYRTVDRKVLTNKVSGKTFTTFKTLSHIFFQFKPATATRGPKIFLYKISNGFLLNKTYGVVRTNLKKMEEEETVGQKKEFFDNFFALGEQVLGVKPKPHETLGEYFYRVNFLCPFDVDFNVNDETAWCVKFFDTENKIEMLKRFMYKKDWDEKTFQYFETLPTYKAALFAQFVKKVPIPDLKNFLDSQEWDINKNYLSNNISVFMSKELNVFVDKIVEEQAVYLLGLLLNSMNMNLTTVSMLTQTLHEFYGNRSEHIKRNSFLFFANSEDEEKDFNALIDENINSVIQKYNIHNISLKNKNNYCFINYYGHTLAYIQNDPSIASILKAGFYQTPIIRLNNGTLIPLNQFEYFVERKKKQFNKIFKTFGIPSTDENFEKLFLLDLLSGELKNYLNITRLKQIIQLLQQNVSTDNLMAFVFLKMTPKQALAEWSIEWIQEYYSPRKPVTRKRNKPIDLVMFEKQTRKQQEGA